MGFAERLRKIRLERGLSQEEIGKILGITKQAVSNYENGNRSPKLEQANEFAQRLKVSIYYLAGEDELPPTPAQPLSPTRAFLMDQARNASEDDVKKMEQLWKMIKDQDN